MKRSIWRAHSAASCAYPRIQADRAVPGSGAPRPTAHLTRVIAALLMVATLAVGSGRWTAGAAGAARTAWRITNQRLVTLGGQTRIVSLSPNGRWLAALTADNVICLYAIPAMRQTHCATLSSGAIYGPSVVWSPDSTHLAFTENWVQFFENPDIWVMGTASGALRDLTPDGGPRRIDLANGSSPRGPKLLVDAAPAWSPDGKSLIFARTVFGQHSTSLYRIGVSGGKPVRVAVIAADQPYALYYGLRWLSDGSILYSLAYPNNQDPRSGLWLLGVRGGTPRRLLNPDHNLGAPLLMQVTPDTRAALVWYPTIAADLTLRPNISAFALVNLAGGAARPLNPAIRAKPGFLGPHGATFSPDGTQVLYTYGTMEDPYAGRLALRATRGGPETVLAHSAGKVLLAGALDVGLGLNWAGNNTVFVISEPNKGVLFTLRRG